jgi:hypothetical protein
MKLARTDDERPLSLVAQTSTRDRGCIARAERDGATARRRAFAEHLLAGMQAIPVEAAGAGRRQAFWYTSLRRMRSPSKA